MRICVCGAQSLYMSGGAELHQDNLVTALRAAGHQAELVRLPVWWSRDRLLQSAFAWRLLTLDAEMVIATNFPSYFVRHPRKVVWLFHQHRAAYDALGQPWSDFGMDDHSLTVHRELVEWDNRALSEASHLFATSFRVADRLRRFNGLTADVLYHPPPLSAVLHSAAAGDYLFCATRLEANKRPELMVSAMAHVRSNVRLVIAGRGSMQKELQAQIRRLRLESRVTLVGFVEDAEIVRLYAAARAVVYVPSDEDYGYVPLQAFYAGKPVITTDDSGGVLEWVKNDSTGVVAPATPTALAEAIDRVAQDVHWSESLGRAGAETVASLSWPDIVNTLLRS
jgi:glycosyltransferase involved in cell wall biosynthesis